MANESLGIVSVQSARQWHDIVTLDESQIYLVSEHDLMWMAPEKSSPTKSAHGSFAEIYAYNPCSNTLPKERKFNAQNSTNNILIAISDWTRRTGGIWLNKLLVHADNARPHNANVSTDFIPLNRMKQAAHPPYSPDVTLSDFFFSMYGKGRLMGYRAESPV
jgi:hypothetical protein